MGSGIRRGRLAATAALLLAALLLAAAVRAGTPRGGSLAGQLLIASPAIGDPRFSHAVILMVRHESSGAFGIMLNRPLGTRSIKSLLAAAGEKDAGVTGSLRVFAGGPVQPELGFVIHTVDYRRLGTRVIDAQLAMTASREILRDIGHGRGPKKYLFALGYAGWAAGQLETELDRHDWYTTPADPALVFDHARETLWDDAMARRTREL